MKLLKYFSLVAVTVFLLALPVSANNSSTTTYSYSLPDMQYYVVYRPGQYKSDTTPAYVDFQSTDYVFSAYGVNYSIHGGYNNQTVSANCTSYVSSCRIYGGTSRRIHTNVYEWGYSYAFIGLNAPNPTVAGNTASGVWSPDSSSGNSAPFAN